MQIKFFEWQDFESYTANKYSIQFPADIKYTESKYNFEEAKGAEVISIFVDSDIPNEDLKGLKEQGLHTILLRCAGFDMLDVEYAKSLGIKVYRVASYSPESIAEHVFALLLNLVRKLNLDREFHEKNRNQRVLGLMGTTLHGKSIGIYGVGKIGSIVLKIAHGFGMDVYYFDKFVEQLEGANKVNSLEELFAKSNIVSVHVPLTDETKDSVNATVIEHAKPGSILINTSRGDIVNSNDVVSALKSGKLGGVGVDVWDDGIIDDLFDDRLLVNNAIQTIHTAFFTEEALQQILQQTLDSLNGQPNEKNIL